MTKTDLIAQVAANTEMSKKSAEQAVSAVFEALGKAMTEGEKITISGAAAACTRCGGFFAERKGTTLNASG